MYPFFKRLLDITLSFTAIIILLPLILIISLLVIIKHGKPILFKQIRPGKNMALFKMYKFRTMTNEKDDSNILLSEEKRLTNFGRKLRSYSLDELPELFNILKGDMSFVGPRPLLVKYLPYYSFEEEVRHKVKPGLTGYAQVNGRNQLAWEERLNLDIYYFNNRGFIFDFKILVKTLYTVIKKTGVIENPKLTMKDLKETRRQQMNDSGFIVDKKENYIIKIFKPKEIKPQTLLDFIRDNDDIVSVPLSNRTNIKDYCNKIHNLATLVTAWHHENLIGLNAIYLYDKKNKSAFITLNIVSQKYQGKKIGRKLLQICFEEAIEHNKDSILLEVNENAKPAINLYNKYGFINFKNSKPGAFFMRKLL